MMEDSLGFIGLCLSQSVKETLQTVSKDLNIHFDGVEKALDVMNKIDENQTKLIVLHTDVGMEVIRCVLDTVAADGVAQSIPLVLISDLDDNESLSSELKNDKVISILTYDNWSYQLSMLLQFLGACKEEEIEEVEEESSESLIDPLTDVLKWSGAKGTFDLLLSDFQDNARPFSFILFTVDSLEKINAKQGEDIGDEVLVSVANIAQQNIRRYDTVVRINEDTFGVFLSGANLEIANTKAESFRYEMEIKGHGFDKIKATASFGVVEFTEGTSLEELHRLSNDLVLKAKEEGGNKSLSS